MKRFLLLLFLCSLEKISSDNIIEGYEGGISYMDEPLYDPSFQETRSESETANTLIILPDDKKKNDDLVIKLNSGIDYMLKVLRWAFTQDGELTLALPDINKEFGHSVYKGTFNATKGTFRNLGSLHRTGDIAFVKHKSSLSLQVALGLSEFVAGFENYDVKILKIHQSGHLEAKVDHNSLSMKLTFSYSPKCSFHLEYIKFEALSGVKVTINGLGVFQTFYNELSKWLITNFEDLLKTIVNEKLQDKLNKVIEKQGDKICKYFPTF